MRHHVSLFLTASFLFLSQGVQASSIDDDNSSVVQGSGVVQVASTASSATSSTSDDLQCYRKINGQFEPLFDKTGKLLDRRAQEPRSESTMTSFEKNGKLLWTNVLSSLAHHVRVAVMEYLQDDPRGQLSLMTVSHGFRRLALVMPERYNDAENTGNDLKKRLFTVLIAGQTGDVERFIKDGQFKAIQTLSLQDLQDTLASRCYTGTLSETTKHGKTYRSIGKENIKMDIFGTMGLSFALKDLCLFSLNLSQASTIKWLDLSWNQLTVLADLSRFTNLERLFLSENQLTVLPGLLSLTNLEELDLTNNQLKELPDLSHLKNLRMLALKGNQLTSVPDLSHLTNLERLDLTNNQLGAVPGLSFLTSMRWLHLTNNQLTVMPDISRLTLLWGLSLSNNQLKEFPDLSHLKNLRLLDLKSNHLRAAPDLSPFTNLQQLNLSNNQLITAPMVTGLLNLTALYLYNNQLTVAPDVSELTKLECLFLDSNLCGDQALLETLRVLNRGRNHLSQLMLYAISKDDEGKEVKTQVSLD